jgi:transposase InsO family protein
MDFMSDQLFDGRRIRLLTIVDNHTRESLAIHVEQRIRGIKVVEVLEKVVFEPGGCREKVEEWRTDYNTERPQSSLNNLTPEEFALESGPSIPEAEASA